VSIVAYKYMPDQMPEAEFRATFAARLHTVEFLVDALRRQVSSGTLSSYFLTGPRGSGKSALLRMVRLRINDDPELNRAWLPVVFAEEQFDVASLRDLFAGALRILSGQQVLVAGEWLERVEAEADDERSEDLAAAGLREIARSHGKRLILFLENLDDFFEALSDRMKGTFRRLLMTDPFMMVLGSAVHVFQSLADYDEAFFNYFCPVPLGRLSDDEVLQLLSRPRGTGQK